MSSDSLLFLNAGSQFVLVVIGGVLLVREDWPRKHPVLTMGALVLVGITGMSAAIRQSQLSARETADAQRRIIDTVTGGKSFCYMDLSARSTSDAMTPVFIPQGGDPLYELHARISNSQKLDEMYKQKGDAPMTWELLNKTEINLSLGNLAPTAALIRFDTAIDIDANAARQDFIIWFDARNGYWFEDLQLRKVGSNWSQAVRVFRIEGSKEKELIFTHIDKNFPGDPQWRN
jgi:hypothetical protein